MDASSGISFKRLLSLLSGEAKEREEMVEHDNFSFSAPRPPLLLLRLLSTEREKREKDFSSL